VSGPVETRPMAREMSQAARAPASAAQRPRPRRASSLGVYATYAASFLTLIVVWHVAATYLVPSVLFSPPLAVLVRLVELARTGVLFEHVGVSLRRILIGFALGSVLGIPIGLLMGNLRFVKRLLEPYTEFFRFIPAIAFLTVAVIWFGIGETSKVFLIVYTTIFIVILNSMAGVLSIPKNKVRAAQCLGASRWQIFFHVSIPATLPFILTGMRIAMGNSFATIVSAEMLGANAGLGTMMWTARLYMLVDEMFVGLFALGILGFATDRLFRFLIFRFAGKYSPVA
jgi:ABC-type nitrate/sulfonate/bicarbonate transport system permease component